MPRMRFSRSLARLRKEKKVSQRTAAGALGVSQALLSHYENGLREPGLEFLVNASRYYGCSVDCLLGIQPPAEAAGAPRGAGLAAEAADALHTFAGDAGDDRLAALADEYLLAAAYRFALTLCGGPQRTLSAVDALMKADELAVCESAELGSARRWIPARFRRRPARARQNRAAACGAGKERLCARRANGRLCGEGCAPKSSAYD